MDDILRLGHRQPVLIVGLDLPVPEPVIINNDHISILGPIFHLSIIQICFFRVALEDFPMLINDIFIVGALDNFNSFAAV